MNQKKGLVITIVALLLCGCPGILISFGSAIITGFGFMTDKAQLKLDTNLDQTSVIWTGMGGICAGLLLILIPILIWLWSKRR